MFLNTYVPLILQEQITPSLSSFLQQFEEVDN